MKPNHTAEDGRLLRTDDEPRPILCMMVAGPVGQRKVIALADAVADLQPPPGEHVDPATYRREPRTLQWERVE